MARVRGCTTLTAAACGRQGAVLMGERATSVHDDLTGEQRARLCIISEIIDVSTTEVDGADLLRYAHWVAFGAGPPQRPAPAGLQPASR